MFSLTEWIIVILVGLIVFGVFRPSNARRGLMVLADLRPQEPVAAPVKNGIEVELALVAGFLLAAAGCVLALVAAHAGWV